LHTQVLTLLQGLFAQLDRSLSRCLDTSNLTDRLGLNTGEQQDPQEFSTLFLEKIKNSFEGGKEGGKERERQRGDVGWFSDSI